MLHKCHLLLLLLLLLFLLCFVVVVIMNWIQAICCIYSSCVWLNDLLTSTIGGPLYREFNLLLSFMKLSYCQILFFAHCYIISIQCLPQEMWRKYKSGWLTLYLKILNKKSHHCWKRRICSHLACNGCELLQFKCLN